MLNIDQILPERFDYLSRPIGRRTVRRTLLCIASGAVEGAVAAVVIFSVALFYHLAILGQTGSEFGWSFYSGCGLLIGIVYGAFSATAWNAFLDQKATAHLMVGDGLYAWTATFALALLVAFLFGKIGELSRFSLIAGYLVGIPVLLAIRGGAQALLGERIREGKLLFQAVSVVGDRVDVLNFLINGELWRQGHKLTATLFLEDARDAAGSPRREVIAEFVAGSLRQGTDHIIFAGSKAGLDELEDVISELQRFALNVFYAPAVRSRSLKFLDAVAIGPNNILRLVRTPMSDFAVLLKRSFDVVSSIFGLVLLSPLLLAIAVAIRLDSPGPTIFRQARSGFNGEPFMIWKFRSMTVTESGYDMHQVERGDARITRVGRLLRQSSLDELPQLVNVLRGSMSLVGPRPHAVSHDEQLGRQVARYAYRQRIKPGITGWAQVNGFRGETTKPGQVEGRIAHDIYYIDNWSIALDLWIILLTLLAPSARRNAR